MRAPLSIVIPTLDAGTALPAALGALGPGLEAGLVREVVVTDGGSTDATRSVAEAAGAAWVAGAPGRGGQLRRGIAASGGDWILALHADTLLDGDWPAAAAAHMRRHPGRAGYFRLRFRAEGLAPRLVAGWANARSRWLGLPYGDQGLLLPRALHDAVGGYPDIPLMEDVAIARALRGRMSRLAATAWTSAEAYERRGWVRRGARNLLTLSRFMAGADPRRLARGVPLDPN